MQALICQNCGAPLEQSCGTVICPYCGSRFVMEPVPGREGCTSGTDFQIYGGTLVKYAGSNLSPIIPEGVCRIGKRAFSGTSIVSVTIPQSVIEIQQYAFADCTELASVTIPASVQNIQNRAFFRCWKLNNVSLLGSPELGEDVFSGTGFRMSQMRSVHNAIEEELDSRLMSARLENGRCPYCGSKYFGILNRVCSRCKRRRPSDVE